MFVFNTLNQPSIAHHRRPTHYGLQRFRGGYAFALPFSLIALPALAMGLQHLRAMRVEELSTGALISLGLCMVIVVTWINTLFQGYLLARLRRNGTLLHARVISCKQEADRDGSVWFDVEYEFTGANGRVIHSVDRGYAEHLPDGSPLPRCGSQVCILYLNDRVHALL
jgi:hypothetical protein